MVNLRLFPASRPLRLAAAPVLAVLLCGQDSPDMPAAGEWVVDTSPVSFEFDESVPATVAKGLRQSDWTLGSTEQSCLERPLRIQTLRLRNLECRVISSEVSDGKAAIRQLCDQPAGAARLSIDGTYSANALSLTAVLQSPLDIEDPGQQVTITMQFVGRRVGDCADK